MRDATIFIEMARQQGYGAPAAAAALAWAVDQVGARGLARQRYYIYRTAGGEMGAASDPAPRPRLLLAFPSADAALGFAQSQGLGSAPRLIALGLGQLLAALIQRPAITSLLFAADSDAPRRGALPPGLRLERAALLELLARTPA